MITTTGQQQQATMLPLPVPVPEPEPSPPAPPPDTRQWHPVVFAEWGYCTDQGTHYNAPAVDAFAPNGTPIYAPESGVSRPATYPLGGYTTILYGDSGHTWYLAHGQYPFTGGRVARGQQIGAVNQSGNARYTSPHVHFCCASDGNINRGVNGGSGNVWLQPYVWGK